MRRRVLVAVCLVALLAACGGGGAGSSASQEADLAFTAPTLDGGQLDGSSLTGRDVVLWFWAPW